MNSWTQKQLRLLDKYIDRLTRLYIDEYEKTLEEVKGLVLELYSKIQTEGDPLISHLYQYKRYYKLTKDIQDKLTKLGVKQEQIFTKEITDYYKKNCAILDDQFERPFSITDQQVEEIVKKDLIDNTLWQESIWKDKALLLSRVRHELVMNLSAGKSVDQMAESLQAKTLTSNFYNCKRLVRQEVAQYYRKSTVNRYEAAGVKEIQ